MNIFSKRNLLGKTALAIAVIFSTGIMQSCSDLWSEQHPGTYYINSGETVADWLLNREEDFSDFIYCLNQADVWGEMRTYGEHTCFAPTNAAFKIYLKEFFGRDDATVQDLTKEQCDTIARTHLCNATFFCKDLEEGTFPYPNLLERYMDYSFGEGQNEDGSTKLIYLINKSSEIIVRDDTVQNGVCHVINRLISQNNSCLSNAIEADSTIVLFYMALRETGFYDKLLAYKDPNYPENLGYDSTLACFKTDKGKLAKKYSTGAEANEYAIWPDERKYKFTAFIPQDETMKDAFAQYGIAFDTETPGDSVQKEYRRLKELAIKIYGEDDEEYKKNPRDSRHSLNKFIAYHLLPEQLQYDRLNLVHPEILKNHPAAKWKLLDLEDYYETMLPHSLIRVSTPYTDQSHRYINRKGTKEQSTGVLYEGIKVIKPSTNVETRNGEYYYIPQIMAYDSITRNEVLNTRMRIACNTMSPDFINSNARGRFSESGDANCYVVGFKKGFCDNIECSDETEFYVRYYNKTFGCYNGDEMTIRGVYDVSFKLLPVPIDGTYEIRMFINTMADSQWGSDRGVVQIYFRSEQDVDPITGSQSWRPCGIPVDLRLKDADPRLNNLKDDNERFNGDDDLISANEKSMRNRGYMKAPDSYVPNASASSTTLRNTDDCVRKILTTEYMRANEEHYIRLRLVLEGVTNAVCPFNFIEVVPKSIYAGDTPEDRL